LSCSPGINMSLSWGIFWEILRMVPFLIHFKFSRTSDALQHNWGLIKVVTASELRVNLGRVVTLWTSMRFSGEGEVIILLRHLPGSAS
jgi:hypothetical protein